MQSKVEICGVNTAKLPVLKNAETMELIRRAQAGDKEAKDTVIMGNLRLVLSVVQALVRRHSFKLFQDFTMLVKAASRLMA